MFARSAEVASSGETADVQAVIAEIEGLLDEHRYVDAVDRLLDLDGRGVDHALLRPLVAKLGRLAAGDAAEHELLGELFKLIIELRAAARAEKRWADADVIRDRLSGLGVTLEDGPDGTVWTRA